jgi:hypothetical protein
MDDQELFRGDAIPILLEFTDEDDAVINITGWTVYFTVRKRPAETSIDTDTAENGAIITKTITSHTDAANGKTTVSLTKTDTNIDPGNYFYDVQIKNTENDPLTIGVAKFIVKPEVTRA